MAKMLNKALNGVTKKATWKAVGTGALAGTLQGLGVFLLGKTAGTILSAVGIGIIPSKYLDEQAKKISIVNQVSDATANLLIGEN